MNTKVERYIQLYKFDVLKRKPELGKTIRKILKWAIYYPLLTFVCLEVALLILGYRRYIASPYKVTANPKNAFIGNDSLGIELNPGTYSITLNDSVNFQTTHTQRKLRQTPRNTSDSIEKNVAFLGCSFTYGYGVNDHETFVAQLQKQHNNWLLENQAVIGYGTVQSLIQLTKITQNQTVDAVILDFSSFHFMRNVLSQTYRKNLKIGYANSAGGVDSLMQNAQFPFVQDTSCTIQLAGWEDMHDNWCGRDWFASVNWVQTFYEQRADAYVEEVKLTAAIINKMSQIAETFEIEFGVVCLDKTEETKALNALLLDVPWVDIEFDFADSNHTHIPYDSHPNALGHQEIAEKIDPFLIQILQNEE